MTTADDLARAAELFKVLGNPSRLALLRLLAGAPRTVSDLVEATTLSQPLVSQHLRTLRQANLVEASRSGREVTYVVVDHHVTHLVDDAVVHAQEADPAPGGRSTPPGEEHP